MATDRLSRGLPGALGGPIDPDALTLDRVRGGALADRPVTVLGFARSGIALARFLADAGARVTIYDGRPEGELAGAIAALEGRQARLLLGPEVDPATAWDGAALVTTSPSINPAFPTTEPRLRAALTTLVERRAAGDRSLPALISEPDLFLRLCPAPTIGVTGTKGKTTTAALTHALFASDPEHPAVLGGNIGIPIIERLPELTPRHRIVYELSELQLPTLSRGTTTAVYTNVTADHLDRHGSLEAYRNVKRRLAELVDPAGALILNAEDPVVRAYAELANAPAILYQRDRPASGGVGVVDGWIVAEGVERIARFGGGPAATGPDGRIMPIAELAIPGRHNVSNALAAVAAALAFGVEPDGIRRAAAAFKGVEHRLEEVARRDGVLYVNDSKATNVDSTLVALASFDVPVHLVLGGQGKGQDFALLRDAVAARARAVYLIGEDAERIAGALDGAATLHRCSVLERAVAAARAAARPGEVVLLSPACASFDQYADFEERGRHFKELVQG
ncbi:MAG: UDP-N-acetylmuramoyl-L-alanine--D-glutamate ligase [Chloroflexota bacterium]